MSDLYWEYGIRYDKAQRLMLVGGAPKAYHESKPVDYVNWGTGLTEESSLKWVKGCVAFSDTPDDLRRVIVRRLVGPVEEWDGNE